MHLHYRRCHRRQTKRDSETGWGRWPARKAGLERTGRGRVDTHCCRCCWNHGERSLTGRDMVLIEWSNRNHHSRARQPFQTLLPFGLLPPFPLPRFPLPPLLPRISSSSSPSRSNNFSCANQIKSNSRPRGSKQASHKPAVHGPKPARAHERQSQLEMRQNVQPKTSHLPGHALDVPGRW